MGDLRTWEASDHEGVEMIRNYDTHSPENNPDHKDVAPVR